MNSNKDTTDTLIPSEKTGDKLYTVSDIKFTIQVAIGAILMSMGRSDDQVVEIVEGPLTDRVLEVVIRDLHYQSSIVPSQES